MSSHIIYDAGDTKIAVGYDRSTRARTVWVYENFTDDLGLKDCITVLTATFEGDHRDVPKHMWAMVYAYGGVSDAVKQSVEEYIVNEQAEQVHDEVEIDWTKGIPM